MSTIAGACWPPSSCPPAGPCWPPSSCPPPGQLPSPSSPSFLSSPFAAMLMIIVATPPKITACRIVMNTYRMLIQSPVYFAIFCDAWSSGRTKWAATSNNKEAKQEVALSFRRTSRLGDSFWYRRLWQAYPKPPVISGVIGWNTKTVGGVSRRPVFLRFRVSCVCARSTTVSNLSPSSQATASLLLRPVLRLSVVGRLLVVCVGRPRGGRGRPAKVAWPRLASYYGA